MPPWAPTGDKWPQMAMVWVYEQEGPVAALGQPYKTTNIGDRWVCSDILHPMPPTITPEQQAVLDAAERQERAGMLYLDGGGDDISGYMDAGQATNRAVRALRKSLAPDPHSALLAAAKAALIDLRRRNDALCIPDRALGAKTAGDLESAIAALEAKS